MKRLIFTLLLIVNATMLKAQFTENFDGPGPYGLTPTGSPGWSIDPTYSTSSPNSYKGEYGIGGTVYLTSNSFSTVGNNFVVLNFKQICKIEFVDTAKIEISIDGGTTWTQVTSANSSYLGAGDFANQYDRFSEISYPADWALGNAIPPTNGWWKNEGFDISQLANNAADVRVRFVLVDFLSNNGLNGNYGWLLDDISVVASPCELIPPTVTPQVGYPIWQNTVYNLGPYDVYIHGEDNSLDPIQPMGELYYSVNGGSYNPVGGTFLVTGDSTWYTQIPPADSVNETICWYAELYDGCGNIGQTDTFCFTTSDGASVPFCDDFENPSASVQLWSFNTVAGTGWDIGNTAIVTPHGGTGVLGVPLSGTYQDLSEAYVMTPIWDFSSITLANLKFWQVTNLENNYDGVVLEVTTNPTDPTPTWTTIGTQNDPNGVNWYNGTISGGSIDAWTGDANGTTWNKSTYKLGSVPGLPGALTAQFRFKFTSDISIERLGFFIDDFCITIPCSEDMGINSLISPLNGTGIPAGQPANISVLLENYGLAAQTGFNIVYQLNSNAPVSTPYTSTLNPGDQATYNLTGLTAPAGQFTVCLWTDLANDCDHTNDSVCVTLVGIPTINAPYCDDFESGNIGWYAQIDPTTNNQTDIWELGTPANGAPTGAFSGTNAWDVNLNAAYGNNALTYLYTPYLDFSSITTGEMKFKLFVDAEGGWDGVSLDYSSDGGVTWTNMANDPNCAKDWYNDNINVNTVPTDAWSGEALGWLSPSYKLCCLNNVLSNPTPVQFRFVFASDGVFGTTLSGGATIDDFCVTGTNGDDAGCAAVNNGGPTNFPSGTAVILTATLSNSSATNTLTSIPVSYLTSDGQSGSFIWTGNLLPCSTVDITLPPITTVVGPMDVCVWTSLPGDVNTANDTSCTTIYGQPTLTPTYTNYYTDNFESGNIGWAPAIDPSATGTSIWEFGTPNYNVTTGAYSPTTAWDVNLNSAVTPNTLTYLYTPYFDLSNAVGATLKFWQNRALGLFGPELRLEYCLNNSNNWSSLNPASTTDVTNWYNNGDFWDDSNGGWQQSVLKNIENATNGGVPPSLIQFRFVLDNGFQAMDGVSIDNFEIFVPIPLSVTPLVVTSTVQNSLLFPGQPVNFSGNIKNNGVITVNNHMAVLTIDGVVASSDFIDYTSIGGLQPDSTLLHPFATNWTAIPGYHQVCVYTYDPNNQTDNYQLDDTTCATVLVFDSVTTSQLPFCTGFESGSQWVTANSDSYESQDSWQIGLPTKATLSGAHTGSVAWATNLTSNYANKDSAGLFSSLIRVQEGHCYKLEFWQRYKMEYGADGGAVDYSIDYGNSWNRVDFTGTPNIQLFGFSPNYTYVTALDPNNPTGLGFTGYRNNWFKTEKTLRPDANTQMIVRWKFASDFSAVDEGWVIDDVCITDLGLCTPLGVNEFAQNNFGLSQNYPNPSYSATSIDYVIPEFGAVKLTVTDLLGQTIAVLADGNEGAGLHTVSINTNDLAGGMYIYTLTYNGEQITKRMIVTK
jgi:hypothetical protein